MNKPLKIILIIINFIMLLLAVYWYSKSSEIEPIIVSLGQLVSIFILLFEGMVAKNKVSGISKSKVEIDTPTNDNSNIEVKDVSEDSEVKIKRT